MTNSIRCVSHFAYPTVSNINHILDNKQTDYHKCYGLNMYHSTCIIQSRFEFQEDEIEDMVGEVKYTDSQKSISTMSNFYSHDFTDSSNGSDKNISSGKETYVIEWDSSEDSDKPSFPLKEKNSIINLHGDGRLQIDSRLSKSTFTSHHKCTIAAEETFTQTSKTIIELADNDVNKPSERNTSETQTSFVSITENKTIEYSIQVSGAGNNYTETDMIQKKPTYFNVNCNKVLFNSLEDDSSKYPASEAETEIKSVSSDRTIKIIDEYCKEIVPSDERSDDNSSVIGSETDSDMEEDSLMAITDNDQISEQANTDVQELHNKLAVKVELYMPERLAESDIRRFGILTPLTEESNLKKDSLMDITPNIDNIANSLDESEDKSEFAFTNNTGIKIKYLRSDDHNKRKDEESLKLPPIKNLSCYNSPHTSSMLQGNNVTKVEPLPCLNDGHRRRDSMFDRWEIRTKDLAAGESILISDRSDPQKNYGETLHLPQIHTEGHGVFKRSVTSETRGNSNVIFSSSETSHDPINIKDKIKELKMSAKSWTKYSVSRSGSPMSVGSRDSHKLDVVADRGCEALCIELLKRLRSSSCYEVMDTLDEIPRVMEKFWGVITEQRIADFIRIMNGQIESPRPRVARAACSTVATILKNTNYTKKPDFYEVVTTLLTKTGSYNRPVRRAANVALDDIVCGVDLCHAVTALCIHGSGHKNALVRCATARLLVVCSALSGGGRELLRARPSSAATARRHALRSLALLLDDKNAEARKYAERLYSMLRPLTNFEAYYLTDVNIELATKQMRKYDQLLLCGPPKEVR